MQKFVKIETNESHLHGQKNRSTFKILTIPSFWLILMMSLTVTLSLIVLSRIFFMNSPWYYLTPCQNLLKLNVVFMVRKVGKKKSMGGCHPPAPSLCLILEPRWLVRSEKLFDGKDETTAKNFVRNKSSSYS